ncbi:glycosyl hydrolase family 28-related protein [Enterobacter cloacae complex sp.]|uniref:glycosyl hydrolase family 28-related protein n=1 Tax=Enterobacter cloacae complex sp. TaxID=2027919 RepID=UPI0010581A18|nr:glycosyl hydrolase family 28-related protein [Enterobacter cloacae complex sp.]
MMSFTDTSSAKKYASIAEIAAAQAKLYADKLESAPDYAAQAAASASASAESAQEAESAVSVVNNLAISASESATNAAASAAEAGNAAAAAVGQCLRVPAGELIDILPDAVDRADSLVQFDSSGQVSVLPKSDIAILDSGGKIPVSMIPAIALTEPFVVSSQAEMLALDAQVGDIAKRTDLGYSFCLAASPASTLSNWVQLTDDVLAQLGLPSGATQVGATDDSGSNTTVQGALGLKASLTALANAISSVFSDLASTAVNKGAYLLGVKQPFTGAVSRTQAGKNLEVVSVQDFGAIPDFNRATNTGTDNTVAFQSALDYCKVSNKALFVPSGWYLVNGNLTATYAPVIYGEGANGVAVTTSSQQDSPFIGSVIVGNNTSGFTLNVSPPNYQFGMSVRNIAFIGHPSQRSNTSHAGVRLHNTGLQGYVENCAISGYGGVGLTIGYLQDTHFISLFVERCGTEDIAAIKFVARANYLYFQDCLLMACHYFIDNTDPTLYGRYVFWSGCHIEHGDYNGALGPEWDFVYKQSSIQTGLGNDWSFQNCIFIPVSNAALAAHLGVSRINVPYFINAQGERFTIANCRFNAPRDSISPLVISNVNFRSAVVSDTLFTGIDAARPCIDGYYVKISNCDFTIDISQDTTRCYGVYVRRGGVVSGCRIGLIGASGARRTQGYLVLTDDARFDPVYVSNNTYPATGTTYVNGYVHKGCTLSGEDGGSPAMVSISPSSSAIDLGQYPPNVNFWLQSASTIVDMINFPYGRRLVVIANSSGCSINSTGNVYPRGNVNFNLTPGVPVEFRAMLRYDGTINQMYQIS